MSWKFCVTSRLLGWHSSQSVLSRQLTIIDEHDSCLRRPSPSPCQRWHSLNFSFYISQAKALHLHESFSAWLLWWPPFRQPQGGQTLRALQERPSSPLALSSLLRIFARNKSFDLPWITVPLCRLIPIKCLVLSHFVNVNKLYCLSHGWTRSSLTLLLHWWNCSKSWKFFVFWVTRIVFG